MKVLRQQRDAAKHLTRRNTQRLESRGKGWLTVSASIITTAAAVTTAAAAAIALAGMIAPNIAATGLMLFLLAGAFVAMGIMRVGFAARLMPAVMLGHRARSHVLVASCTALGSNTGRCKSKLPLQKSEHQHGAEKHG